MDLSNVTKGTFYASGACTSSYTAPTFSSFDGKAYLDATVNIEFANANDGDCPFEYTLSLVCDNDCGITS